MKFLTVFYKLAIGEEYIRVVRKDLGYQMKRALFYVQAGLYALICCVFAVQDGAVLRCLAAVGFSIAELWVYRFLYLPIEEAKCLDLSVEDGVLTYCDGSVEMVFPMEKIREVEERAYFDKEQGHWSHALILTVDRRYAMDQPVMNHILPTEQGRFVMIAVDTLPLSHTDHRKLCRALEEMVNRNMEFVPCSSPFERVKLWTR